MDFLLENEKFAVGHLFYNRPSTSSLFYISKLSLLIIINLWVKSKNLSNRNTLN